MPRFRELTVSITDSIGNDLEEWGVQLLRSQNKASAYIQATTNMAFKVTIKPRLPFRDSDFPGMCYNDLTMDEPLELQEQDLPSDEFENPDLRATDDSQWIRKKAPINNVSLNIAFKPRRAKSYSKFSNRHNRNSGPSNESTRFSSPIRSHATPSYYSPVPYHLLASLFLDGRRKPERKLIVYLDPADDDFAQPDGKVTFRSRWVQGKDESLKEHSWVFKDVGIETVFDRMLIGGGTNCVEIREEHDEDAIVDAMRATGLGAENNIEEDKNNIGQILVLIERVVLGAKWRDSHYRSKHQEGEDAEDVDMAGVKNEITHTTGLEHTATRSAKPVRVVSYFPYIEGQKPYATFQFFYRSQETLEKFGFSGFPRSCKIPARGRCHMEDTFANVTPLSITYPLPPAKRKGRSFEENIKEMTFSEAEKKQKCNDTHRQLAPVKVNSNGMSKRKPSPTTTSTLSTKPAPTSPRKRPVQVLEASHQGNGQNPGTEQSSVQPSNFTAEQTSQAAFSISGQPRNSAKTLSSSGLVSFGLDSTTQGMSTNLATQCLKAETQGRPLRSSSSVLGIVDTKAAAELSKISCIEYRGSGQASDADDENDESDIDRYENTDAGRLSRDSVVPSPETDDQGLHTEFQAMLWIQSENIRIKEGNDEHNSESSTTSPLKAVKIKMECAPSKPGLSSGTAKDADEEDNATKEYRPPIEKMEQSLLHPGDERAKL